MAAASGLLALFSTSSKWSGTLQLPTASCSANWKFSYSCLYALSTQTYFSVVCTVVVPTMDFMSWTFLIIEISLLFTFTCGAKWLLCCRYNSKWHSDDVPYSLYICQNSLNDSWMQKYSQLYKYNVLFSFTAAFFISDWPLQLNAWQPTKG